MIEQINLEGFTGTVEAKYEGEKPRIRTITFFLLKTKRILALTRRISHENPPYCACAFF